MVIIVDVDDSCWGGCARYKVVSYCTHMPYFLLMTLDIDTMRYGSGRHVTGILTFVIVC